MRSWRAISLRICVCYDFIIKAACSSRRLAKKDLWILKLAVDADPADLTLRCSRPLPQRRHRRDTRAVDGVVFGLSGEGTHELSMAWCLD